MLYDSDSKFALSTQGPLRGDSFIDPDPYRHLLAAFSRGVFDAKRQQRLVRPAHLLPSRGGEHDAAEVAARYPVLIAAAFYTAANEDLDFLIDYAQAGGHLVVGPRTGYGDREGRARTERAPAGSPTRPASGTTRWLRCRHRWRYTARCRARRPDSPKGLGRPAVPQRRST